MGFESLLLLLVGLVLVTVIGHGIWVFLAFLYRKLFHQESLAPPRRETDRVREGEVGARGAAGGSQTKPEPEQDLVAYRRIVNFLSWKGWLLPSERRRFFELSERLEESLRFERAAKRGGAVFETEPDRSGVIREPAAADAVETRRDAETQTGQVQPELPEAGGAGASIPGMPGSESPASEDSGADSEAGADRELTGLEVELTGPEGGLPADAVAEPGASEELTAGELAAGELAPGELAPGELTPGELQSVDDNVFEVAAEITRLPAEAIDGVEGVSDEQAEEPELEPVLASLVTSDDAWLAEPATVEGAASAPVDRRRALSEVLQSFLVDHNIRWGELVAGILIVVCSIGLVVSLWSTLTETNRLLPVGVFLVAVAAIEGAGLYTLRRWKLRHTSRAVLLIATMLVPLSMMAGISIAGSGEDAVRLREPLTMSATVAGGLICLGMLWASGGALVGRPTRWLWTLLLGVPTILLPLASATARTESAWGRWLMLAAGAVVGLGAMWEARRLQQKPAASYLLTAGRRHAIMLMGLAAYALAILLAMFVVRGKRDLETLVPLILALLPALVGVIGMGLAAAKRTSHGPYRVAFHASVVVLVVLLIAALPTAMAHFEWVGWWALSVGLAGLIAGVLTGQPLLTGLAACAAAVWVPLAVSVWWSQHPWDAEQWLWRRYVSGDAMVALLLLAGAECLLSWGWHVWTAGAASFLETPKTRRRESVLSAGQGRVWAIAGVGTAVFATLIGAAAGLGPSAWLESLPRPVLVGMFAAVAMVIASSRAWWRGATFGSRAVAWLALLVALLHYEIWWRVPFAEWSPRLLAVVAGSAIADAVLGEWAVRHRVRERRGVWRWSGGTAVVALVLTIWVFGASPLAVLIWSGVMAALLLVATWRTGQAAWLSLTEIASGWWVYWGLRYWDPHWWSDASAWRSTESWCYVIALAAGVAVFWNLFQDASVWRRFPWRRACRRDGVRVEVAFALLIAAGWGALVAFNQVRIDVAHALGKGLAFVDPAAFAWAGVGMGVLGIARVWPWLPGVSRQAFAGQVVGEMQRRAASASQFAVSWPIAAHRFRWWMLLVLVPMVGVVFTGLFMWGDTARGLTAQGWSGLLTAAVLSLGVGWSSWYRHVRARETLGVVALYGLLTLAGAVLAMWFGPWGWRSDAWAASHWLVWTLAAWGVVVAVIWGALSDRLDRVWPALVSVIWFVTTSAALGGWLYPRETMWGTLAGFAAAGLLCRCCADAWHMLTGYGVADQRRGRRSQHEVASSGWLLAMDIAGDCLLAPSSLAALFALSVTCGVAVWSFFPAFGANVSGVVWPTLWCGLGLAATLVTTRWLNWRRAGWQIAAWHVLLHSALWAWTLHIWGMIAAADLGFAMATIWCVGSWLAGVPGVFQRSLGAVLWGVLAATAVCILGWWEQEASWRWLGVAGGAAVTNVLLGLVVYLRGMGTQIGQSISLVGVLGMLGVLALMPVTAATQIALAGLLLAWLGVIWLAAMHWCELQTERELQTGKTARDLIWFPELLWVSAVVLVLFPVVRVFAACGGLRIPTAAFVMGVLTVLALTVMAWPARARMRSERWVVLIPIAIFLCLGNWMVPALAERWGVSIAFGLAFLQCLGVGASLWARGLQVAPPSLAGYFPAVAPQPTRLLIAERVGMNGRVQSAASAQWAAVFVALILLVSSGVARYLTGAFGVWAGPLCLWSLSLLGPLVLKRFRWFEPSGLPVALGWLLCVTGVLQASLHQWGWVAAVDAWRVTAGVWTTVLVAAVIWAALRQRHWAMAVACVLSIAAVVLAVAETATQPIDKFWCTGLLFVAGIVGPLAWWRLHWRAANQWHALVVACFLIPQWASRSMLPVGDEWMAGVLAIALVGLFWRVCEWGDLLGLWGGLAEGSRGYRGEADPGFRSLLGPWLMGRARGDTRAGESVEHVEMAQASSAEEGLAVARGSAVWSQMWVEHVLGLVAVIAAAYHVWNLYPFLGGSGMRGVGLSANLSLVVATAFISMVGIFLAVRHSLTTFTAYLATQLLGAALTIWWVPVRDDLWPVSVACLVASSIAGLWGWAWPLILYLYPPDYRNADESPGFAGASGFELPARRALGIGLQGTALSVCLLAAGGLLIGMVSDARWFFVAAAGAMCPVLATLARWWEVYLPPDFHHAGLTRRQSMVVVLATLLLAALGQDPTVEPWWLLVTMRVVVIAVLVPPLALWGAPRIPGLSLERWRQPLWGLSIQAMVLGALALPLMFVREWMLRGSAVLDGVPLHLVIGIAVLLGVAAVGAAVAGVCQPEAWRVLPALTARQRQACLYAAQALGGLAWLHVFLCRPELAMVSLRPYWPYVVMGLAFLSAGLAHWGRRRNDEVVGGTLRQTTLFLPLIPVIGFWISGERGEWAFLGDRVPYSFLLLVAAMFYGLLAVLWRRDRIPRIAGIVLANAALWVVLVQQPNLGFTQHPQFWLIPPAVCVLGVAQAERQRLDWRVLAAIRYGCALTIYVSSTADILLGEIGKTLSGPIILIVLALAGMLLGVVLRTRAFLYLGTLFVLVGVLSMVWHAGRAIDQNWPWWVFGITMGCLILGGLMAIEKNRPRLQAWVNKLSRWDV